MRSAKNPLNLSLELAQLVDQLTDQLQQGLPIDWAATVRDHPQHAAELAELAPSLEMLGRCARGVDQQCREEPTEGLIRAAEGPSGAVERQSGATERLSRAAEGLSRGTEGPAARLDDFRIVREVGRGGMGVVYEAQQLSLPRRVALKVLPRAGFLDERRLQRFRTEVQAAAQLQHPHIVPVFAAGEQQNVSFYTMQFIDGVTLADLIAHWRRAVGADRATTSGPGPKGPRTLSSTQHSGTSDSVSQHSGSQHSDWLHSDWLHSSVWPSAAEPLAAEPLEIELGRAEPLAPEQRSPERSSSEPSVTEPPLLERRGGASASDKPELAASQQAGKRTSSVKPRGGVGSGSDRESLLELGPHAPRVDEKGPAAGANNAGVNTAWGSDVKARARAVVQWMIQAADAIEHAHQQGILHRDLKPANLMVDHQQRLWVTDFGLARFHDELSATVSGELVGTLRYMSPEQAAGSKFLDERTDVYSLGATLYELLCLQPLFPHDDAQRLLHAVLCEQPTTPRRAEPSLPRDLETIVLKATAKERNDRYGGAGELAEDLRCWLEDRPIQARRLGVAERGMRWISHNPAMAMLVGLVGMLCLALVAGGIWHQDRLAIKAAQLAAVDAQLNAQRYLALRTQAARVVAERRGAWTTRALTTLGEAARVLPAGQDIEDLRSEVVNALSSPDLVPLATLPHRDVVHCLKFNRSGRQLAVGYNLQAGEVAVELWDPATYQLLETLTFPADKYYVTSRGVAGDGVRSLAYSNNDRWLAVGTRSGWIHLWDLRAPERQPTSWQLQPATSIVGLRFLGNDQQLIVAGQSGELSKWSIPDHRLLQQRDLGDELCGISGSRDGQLLCAVNKRAVVMDPNAWNDLAYGYTGEAKLVSQSPSRGYTVWAADRGRLLLMDPRGNPVRELRNGAAGHAHPGLIRSLDISADGRLIAASCSEQVLVVWDATTGALVSNLNLGTNGNIDVDFSVTNLMAVTVDRETRLFRVNGATSDRQFAAGALPIVDFAVGANSRHVVTLAPTDVSEQEWIVKLSNERNAWYRPIYSNTRPLNDVVGLANVQRVFVSVNNLQVLQAWDEGKPLCEFAARDVKDVQYDPSRREIWAACANPSTENEARVGGIRGWSLDARAAVGAWSNEQAEKAGVVTDVGSLALSNTLVVGGGHDGTVVILQRFPLKMRCQVPLKLGRVRAVAITPDEAWVLAAGDSGEIVLLSSSDGHELGRLAAHEAPIESLAVCQRRPIVASGCADGFLRVWLRSKDGLSPLMRLPRQENAIVRCRFAGDGQLFSLARDGTTVHRWNLMELQQQLQPFGLDW